jgi:hypothetical protein
MTVDRMTTAEAANYIGLSAYILRIARSRITKQRTAIKSPPFIKIGGRYFYDRHDLDAWLAACPRGTRISKSQSRN